METGGADPEDPPKQEVKAAPRESVQDSLKSLQSLKSFQRSPSLQDRLQQALAKKTGQHLPIVDGRAENPPANLSQRLQAIVGKQRPVLNGADRGSFGSREHASKEALAGLRHDTGGEGIGRLSDERDDSEGQDSLLGFPASKEHAHQQRNPEKSSQLQQSPTSNPSPMLISNPAHESPDAILGPAPSNGARETDFDALARRIIDEMERQQHRAGSFSEARPSRKPSFNFPSSRKSAMAHEMSEQSGAAVGPDLNLPAELADNGAGYRKTGEQVQNFLAQTSNMDDSAFPGGPGVTQEEIAVSDIPFAAAASQKRGFSEALGGETLKPFSGGGLRRAQIVDLSSDSSDEEEPNAANRGSTGGFHFEGNFPPEGKKRQLPEWAAPGRPSKRPSFGPRGGSAPGGLDLSLGGAFGRALSPESEGHSSDPLQGGRGRVLPNWYTQRSKDQEQGEEMSAPSQGLSTDWPVAKPGSLEALRGAAGGGGGAAFGRSQSMLDKEAAKALAGPLREAALAHSGQQGQHSAFSITLALMSIPGLISVPKSVCCFLSICCLVCFPIFKVFPGSALSPLLYMYRDLHRQGLLCLGGWRNWALANISVSCLFICCLISPLSLFLHYVYGTFCASLALHPDLCPSRPKYELDFIFASQVRRVIFGAPYKPCHSCFQAPQFTALPVLLSYLDNWFLVTLPASLQSQYQQQVLEHQRQQQAHFQRRLLPATMHTHTLAAGPSAPRENDVALRGVLEGMAVNGPSEEADPPEGSMTVPLLKHQKLALSWMKKRESGTISNQPVGGILADDQVRMRLNPLSCRVERPICLK